MERGLEKMTTDILQAFTDGQIFSNSHNEQVKDLPWHDHPTFPGVSLKHLVTAKNSAGKFSSHLVRVKRGCEIGEHIHEGKWELHEVFDGQGICLINGEKIDYVKGVAAVIPADIPHVVQATESDLYIMAKFVPALL